jgi:YesN/AraC family two-component response regulator
MPRWDNFKWKKPTNNPKWPSNEAEVEKRVTQVYNLLIMQYTTAQIKVAVMWEYEVSHAQVDRYIAKAKQWLSEENELTRDQRKKEVARKIKYLQQRASKDKKRGDVWKWIDLEMELFWLKEPKKIQVSWWISISESRLKKFWGYLWLSDEEKELAEDMTGLKK